MYRRLVIFLGAAFVFLLAGCNPSAPSPSTGTLQVNISGLPSGVNANVTLTKPDASTQLLTTTSTLTGLVSGDYLISSATVPGAGDSANYGYAGSINGSNSATITVAANATTNASVTYTVASGALTLTVGNLPSSANANILVTGPASFSQTVAQTITLPRLSGTYTITPSNVREGKPIVDTLWLAPAATTVQVEAGVTASRTIDYTPRGGTGFLWIPVADNVVNGAVVGLSADQLASATAAGGTVTPARSLSFTGGRGQQAVFDSSGNLYVVSSFFNSIRKYTPEQLAANTPPTPVILTSAALTTARRAAFDAQGNLWVANGTGLVAFTSQQLAAGGSQSFSRELASSIFSSLPGNPLSGINGVAFDSAGNLWVSTFSTAADNRLVRFTPQQVAAGGSFAPADLLEVRSASFNSPGGLAFDVDGSLWVANFAGNNLLKLTAAQLSAGGSQTPSVVLSGFDGPRGLAFDNGGNLWVTQAFGTVLQIAASGLAASGSPTPAKSLSGYGENNLAALAFSPTPSNLPIQNK